MLLDFDFFLLSVNSRVTLYCLHSFFEQRTILSLVADINCGSVLFLVSRISMRLPDSSTLILLFGHVSELSEIRLLFRIRTANDGWSVQASSSLPTLLAVRVTDLVHIYIVFAAPTLTSHVRWQRRRLAAPTHRFGSPLGRT